VAVVAGIRPLVDSVVFGAHLGPDKLEASLYRINLCSQTAEQDEVVGNSPSGSIQAAERVLKPQSGPPRRAASELLFGLEPLENF